MTAGMNVRGRIWRITTPTDDDVGGAVVTGTVIYNNVWGRLGAQRASSLLLEQGIEVSGVWMLLVRPAVMMIRERDEYEVTFPTNHLEYGNRFRIVGVRATSMHPSDSRGFLELTMTRSTFAHAEQ